MYCFLHYMDYFSISRFIRLAKNIIDHEQKNSENEQNTVHPSM